MSVILIIFKWLFIVLGVFLLITATIIAIFDDTPDRWFGIVPLAIFGGGFAFSGYVINTKKESIEVDSSSAVASKLSLNLNEKQLTKSLLDAELRHKKQVRDYQYSKQQVFGKAFQAMESVDVVETTKNIDTLISRYDFLNTLIPELIIASHHNRYSKDVQEVVDHYKQMYYDKTPTHSQLILLLKPIEFDLETFGLESVYNCTIRFYQFQLTQIDVLKTENGKKARYKKLIENIRISKEYIYEHFLSPKDFEKYYDHLSNIENELNDKLI